MSPFLRSVLLSEKMKAFQELQRRCPAYLGLGEKIIDLVLLGTAEDQRETLVRDCERCER